MREAIIWKGKKRRDSKKEYEKSAAGFSLIT